MTNEFDLEVMPSGVRNLDIVLGGGIPVGSFNLLAGGPGAGKTILSQQVMFHNATPERRALHFTVLGEPVAKLLRYQSRFSFFDSSKINSSIFYVDIGDVVRKEGLERGLEMILSRVERYAPSIVVVDSVRAVREVTKREGEYGLRTFTHDLAQVAVVWNTTSLMLGEYEENELRAGPEFTMADGIIWLAMERVDNSVVRKLQVVKSRGMDIAQGMHSFKIDSGGLYIYPRVSNPQASRVAPAFRERATFGIPGLDKMMNGGVPRGEVCLVAGASGTAKSLIGQHFVAEGISRGEAAVIITFEESVPEYAARGKLFGWDFETWEKEGKIATVYGRPSDLLVDEVIDEARKAVARVKASRVVVDSISGFELARAAADQSNFREALQRMVGWLTGSGATVLMTTEIQESFGELRFSMHDVSFVTDSVILLRYTEIESTLKKVMAVIKMRASNHDKELRVFDVVDRKGIVVGSPLREYTGVLTGAPTLVAVLGPQPFTSGLDEPDGLFMQLLFDAGTATAADMASQTGMTEAEAHDRLERLVGMGYVVREEEESGPVYRVSMVTWSPAVSRARFRQGRSGGGQQS